MRSAPLVSCGVFLLVVLGSALSASAQGRPNAEKIANFIARDAELDEAQTAKLTEVVEWLFSERDAIRKEREAGTLTPVQLRERRAKLREDLTARLDASLGPEVTKRLPVERMISPQAPFRITPRVGLTGYLPAEHRRGGGRFSLLQEQVRLSVLAPLWPGAAVFGSVQSSVTHYGFQNAFELDPLEGDPIDTAYAGSVRLGLQFGFADKWALFISGSVGFSAEDGARIDDSVTGGTISGVTYQLNDNVQLGLGIFARTQLEDDPTIFPIPILKVTLDLSDSLQFVLGTREGIGLIYSPTANLQIASAFTFVGGAGTADTRLDSRGFAPRGVLRSRRFPFQVEATWTPLGPGRLELQAGVGVFVYQKLEIDDERGERLTDVKTDPAVFGTFGVAWSF